MRSAVLFIAVSLDGYLADPAGSVDWLQGQQADQPVPDVYGDFVKTVDTVIMGWNTYHQIVTQLSPGHWVYGELTSYVVTHRPCPPADGIRFTDTPPALLVKRLKKEAGKDIWICGGANLVRQLMETDAIDQYYISLIPTLLGGGIRLFDARHPKTDLTLLHTQSYNGIVHLVYQRRHPNS